MRAGHAAAARQRLGKYELVCELGRGGMAELYLARLAGVHGFAKFVAIKRILPHLAHDRTFVDMFLNEGRITGRLSHPNVCSVYELAQDGSELYLVMEYLDGVGWDALAEAVPRDPWGVRLVASVLAQACEGLHYAHTLRELDGTPVPVVHRDVSPHNLFVTRDGLCKVLDFGVSKIANDHSRTRTGIIKGKLPYMAPEQIHGAVVDGRADAWAIGVVFWEALAGRRLFVFDAGSGAASSLNRHNIPLGRLSAVLLTNAGLTQTADLSALYGESSRGGDSSLLPVYGPGETQRLVDGLNTAAGLDGASRGLQAWGPSPEPGRSVDCNSRAAAGTGWSRTSRHDDPQLAPGPGFRAGEQPDSGPFHGRGYGSGHPGHPSQGHLRALLPGRGGLCPAASGRGRDGARGPSAPSAGRWPGSCRP